ncbi:MAG: DUF3857 domain-containing protein [Bacteroidota bacterium]
MRYFSVFLLLLNVWSLSAQLEQIPNLEFANEMVRTEGEVELISESEGIFSVKKQVTILNEASRANFFSVYYDSENKILDLDAKITDLSGNEIRKVRKSEIRDRAVVDGTSIYPDSRVRYIELHHSSYPYILEFSYKKRLKGIGYAAFPNWMPQERTSSSVISSVFTIKVPISLDIQYRAYNIDVEPSIWESEGMKTYTWKASNIPAMKMEPYGPPWHRVLPMVRISPEKFKIAGYSGRMDSWQSYGAFLYDLHEGRDQLPVELIAEVNSLTEGVDNRREKIELLYRFMQENKRYVSVQLGIGGWQPFDATYVEEHGYGDCKALSNYMKALLNAVGIKSYPVVIYADRDQPYQLEDDFVDPAFNHEILYVPEEDMWLECTSAISVPGYLGMGNQDRRVLLITPTGGQIAHTPAWGDQENITQENMKITLAKDGSATLDYHGDKYGGEHEKWRALSFYASPEELESKVRALGRLPSLTLGEVHIDNSEQNPQSILKFDATAARYASKAGKRLFVPLNLICPKTDTPDLVAERKYPVVLQYGYTKESTIAFDLPAGYGVESVPKDISLTTPFGTYEMTTKQENNQLIYHRKLVIYAKEQPAETYTDFREFYTAIVKADASKMVLVAE